MTPNLPAPSEDNPMPVMLAGTDWQQAAHDWLTNFASLRTQRAYRAAWIDFLGFVRKAPVGVTSSDVLAYRHHLEQTPSPRTGKSVVATTINQRLSALGSFYTFAISRGLLDKNPCEGVRHMPVSPYGKATWLDGEQEQDIQLLETVDRETIQGKRDYALLLIFLTTAVRVDAVANLRAGSLRFQGDNLYLRYTNKGGESAEKQLETITAGAILTYLDTRGDLSPPSPLFVATARGKRVMTHLPHLKDEEGRAENPLTARTIEKLVKKYCDQAFGKGHGITPHSLRHTAAMNAIIEGASVIEVSSLLQHKSIGITTIYLHATDKAGDRISRKLGQRYNRGDAQNQGISGNQETKDA
jgi:integrase/recombinase XerC